MFGRRRFVKSVLTIALLATRSSVSAATAADKVAEKQANKVAGILIDKTDDWLTVKADGDDEPVKYLVGDGPNKALADALKGIFNASRVQLTYKQDGESRQLLSIKKQVIKATGTVTGAVVKVYNDFWVEVKPKRGLADAYAPGANYNDQVFMAKLKGLKPGDVVTIKFTTDFERHRIVTLRTAPPSAKPRHDDEHAVSGILIDRHDDWISVKADGEDEPVKYLAGGSDEKLSDALKTTFTASRVKLTYKTDGDSRRLVSIERHVPKASGTVTGTVVKTYDWWIEVKPKNGLRDGYAVHFPFEKNQEMMDKLKALKVGDSVTIRFTTDFERHRIEMLRKNENGSPPSGGME